jgi:DNA-directed RNA polymerase specialized sigma24 family protein
MELYRPVSQKISAYCRAISRSNAEAEDLLHDTLLVAYEKVDQLRKLSQSGRNEFLV